MIKLEPDAVTVSAVVVLFIRQTNPWFGGYKGREGYDTIYRNKCGKNWVGLRTLLLGAAG